jgi:hypothetical protein
VQTNDKPVAQCARFLDAFRGSFTSALRWPQLDALWARILEEPAGWYAYHVGEPPPVEPVTPEELRRFLTEVDRLLRREHDEDYCGIVYADDLVRPAMVKIYDPGNLGMVCGSSAQPPLPGWVLSRLPPVDLPAQQPARGRKRWWERVLGRE